MNKNLSNKMNLKMKALVVGMTVAALVGVGGAAAATGVDSAANVASVSDDAPGHVSGKNRTASDD